MYKNEIKWNFGISFPFVRLIFISWKEMKWQIKEWNKIKFNVYNENKWKWKKLY